MHHLYEVVFESQLMWLKVQAVGDPERDYPALPMLQARFGGTTKDQYESSFSIPFRLSERSQHILNWEDIKDSLPAGWDDHEFQLAEGPYPWCDTLSDGCDCHATKGGLESTYCSDFGLLDETDRRTSKSQNECHRDYIRRLEQVIAKRDQTRRRKKNQRGLALSPQDVAPPKPPPGASATPDELAAAWTDVVNRVNRLMAQRYYCQIEGCYHPCSEQVKQRLMADAVGTVEQLGRLPQEAWQTVMSSMDAMLAHLREKYQSNECAAKVVRGEPDMPEILYKYIPKCRIGSGAPNSLRATQIRALNDVMECNVETINTDEEMDTLQFIALVQSKLGEHLGMEPEWEDLLTQSVYSGDLRLSTFFQDYLTPHVGVVSLNTDPREPTMWAHYSRNTGIVVGYDMEALRNLGFALRPMLYSEMAPAYRPAREDTIQLGFFDRERLQEQTRQGETPNSFRVIATANLAEMGAGWRALSPSAFCQRDILGVREGSTASG